LKKREKKKETPGKVAVYGGFFFPIILLYGNTKNKPINSQ